MKTAKFVTEVTVIDPDTHLPVEVAIVKIDSEGPAKGIMFGVDSAYILTLSDDDPVQCPIYGDDVQLRGV